MKKNIENVSIKRISSKKVVMLIICLIMILNIISVPIKTYAASKYTQTVKSGVENFPKEYQEYLNKLKENHPNWSFDAYYTGISWNELLANETDHGHNRVIKTADESWRCSCGNVASGYACASSGITAYYLDPRNFLDDVSIFQFLEISYNQKVHKLEGIEKSVKNTFLDNTVTFILDGKEKKMSYAEIILEAAKESNMSPYSIRTKIIQEVGSKGSSSVTGKYEGYEGYYNFFNYGAYDAGNAIVNALEYAKKAGWDNQYTAIIEGAKLLANSYTNAGQNTAYFYKWDVVGNSILTSENTQTFNDKSYFFRHQYMTNVQDPKSQSKTLFNLYANAGILDENLNFIIPIYDNMPENPVELPSKINQAEDKLIYIVTDSDGINVRKEPTTSSNKLCSIPKNTKVIVLEKNSATANGYVWYKVQLENSVVGYVASNYIEYYSGKDDQQSENNNNTKPVEEPKVKLDKEKSNLTVIPEVTGKIISEDLNIKNYTITDSKGNKLEDDALVGTGYKITNTDTKETYTIIKLGDTNGDGKINSADLLVIQKHLLEVKKITDNSKILSSDANGDGKVNSADLLKIQKQLLNVSKISL